MDTIERLISNVKKYAEAGDMQQTLTALELMQEYHEGQFRKGDDKIPYIIHPLTVAFHAISLGIMDDSLVAAGLLHDVLEDCAHKGATPENLLEKGISAEIVDIIVLLTFIEIDDMTKDESKAVYFDKIGKNQTASIIKLLDRCNNLSTMFSAFSTKKMEEYIDETEKYILPILEKRKGEDSELELDYFLLEYQLTSVIECAKHMIIG